MTENISELESIKARLGALENQVAELLQAKPIMDRRITNNHKLFMELSNLVIDINETLNPILHKVFPGVSRGLNEVQRIVRRDPRDDGRREPPNS